MVNGYWAFGLSSFKLMSFRIEVGVPKLEESKVNLWAPPTHNQFLPLNWIKCGFIQLPITNHADCHWSFKIGVDMQLSCKGPKWSYKHLKVCGSIVGTSNPTNTFGCYISVGTAPMSHRLWTTEVVLSLPQPEMTCKSYKSKWKFSFSLNNHEDLPIYVKNWT